ncbi:CRISPR-associated protein Cas8c/Csp2, subtype PGING [Mariniphaga anaerophila]|uniref:CRISPR-associated protein Cas8c/Csp2, subtype PGING n=1 Tax=Mariniphaga anaerophila TaxID=1484053 RepID=A0A1M4WQZ3_9BACT|nr:type I-PGING CRISPR-associated protein Cas8c/Csp2 [Mariniphaga anaerophila]SHE83638.1 CRISPR-associated protein Cas8c/Csp2, subtype PGING [Mariniphaga anaerophila]
MNHPFIRYGQAIVCEDNNLSKVDEITNVHIKQTLEACMEKFRCIPSETFEEKENIKFSYTNEDSVSGIKNKPDFGIYLSPHVITSDGAAATTWKYAKEVCALLGKGKNKTFGALNATTPMAGDYMKFTETGGTTKANAGLNLVEIAFSLISVMTSNKPSIYFWDNSSNFCLIPDLSENNEIVDFIQFFKRMYLTKEKDFFIGKVLPPEKGKRKTYKPNRPNLYAGNFPNAPKSFALGSVALLGAIGEFTKESEYSEQAKRVLESLKNATMYQIESGGAKPFFYNHYVVDLAKQGKLKTIVDSLYYSTLYNQGKRFGKDVEYQKFDLFTSRFLQLFNHAAFKDFLAFRAEYPKEVTLLFNTYFIKMEKIDPQIVSSARSLGKWLNKVAYFAAKAEIEAGSSNYWEKLRGVKSKVLVELESSTFSSKSGDALIAQAITRAGRLSGMDAPEAAALFMEKTASGELPLENAKNLLIAFSRLTNKTEKQETPEELKGEDDEMELPDQSEI